jgi:hypothetical protein
LTCPFAGHILHPTSAKALEPLRVSEPVGNKQPGIEEENGWFDARFQLFVLLWSTSEDVNAAKYSRIQQGKSLQKALPVSGQAGKSYTAFCRERLLLSPSFLLHHLLYIFPAQWMGLEKMDPWLRWSVMIPLWLIAQRTAYR